MNRCLSAPQHKFSAAEHPQHKNAWDVLIFSEALSITLTCVGGWVAMTDETVVQISTAKSGAVRPLPGEDANQAGALE
eukprot:645933-Rhodomonas_salina.1